MRRPAAAAPATRVVAPGPAGEDVSGRQMDDVAKGMSVSQTAYVDASHETEAWFRHVVCFTHETSVDGFLKQIQSGGLVAGGVLRAAGLVKSAKQRDDQGGGGMYVYTRVVTASTKSKLGAGSIGAAIDSYPVMLVLDPTLMRRMDMWTTGVDRYGKTPDLDATTHGMDRTKALRVLKDQVTSSSVHNETGFYQRIAFEGCLRKVVVKGATKADALRKIAEILDEIGASACAANWMTLTHGDPVALFSYGVQGELVQRAILEDRAAEVASYFAARGASSSH